MFEKAIEIAGRFTRGIHLISRNYQCDRIQTGTATLFFVNSEGWALTCRHVAEQFRIREQINAKRQAFLEEFAKFHGQKKERQLRRELERKHGYNKNVTYELYDAFANCVEGPIEFEIKPHAILDVALIKFKNFTRLLGDSFPIFAKDGSGLKQGKFLCRLGFPFPEFTNFAYDAASDTIGWTDTGRKFTPQFPIEGMLTRHLLHESGQVVGFEMSTPGLRGQSGGPAFDSEGIVWGMQAATNHLDLNFDVNQEVLRGGILKQVKDNAFLHVGHCVHIDVLKSFMQSHGVQFEEQK